MQLRVARLCLDCEEVHAAQQCPVCASESFAYLSRWIPAPERRGRPRGVDADSDVDRERLDALRGLSGGSGGLSTGRMLTGGVVGLTAVSLLGWLWKRGAETSASQQPLPGGATPKQPAGSAVERQNGGVRESVDR